MGYSLGLLSGPHDPSTQRVPVAPLPSPRTPTRRSRRSNFKWVHNLAIDSKGRSIRPRLAMAAECRSSSAKTECAAKAAVTWLLYLNPQCLWGYTGRGKTYVSTGKDDSKSNCRRRGIISPKSDQEPR